MSVQSPSDPSSSGGVNGRYLLGGSTWRPVWRKNGSEEAENFYTIRVVNGQRQVIKRRSAHWYAPLLLQDNTVSPNFYLRTIL